MDIKLELILLTLRVVDIDTFNRIRQYMGGSIDNTLLWFHTPNEPMFGGLAPKEFAAVSGPEEFNRRVLSVIDKNRL